MKVQIIGRYENGDIFRNRHRKLAMIEIDPESTDDLQVGEVCMVVKQGIRPLSDIPLDALVDELTHRSEGLTRFPS